MSSSVYDVAIRIAADSKELISDIKQNTGMLQQMGVVAAAAFGAGMIKDAGAELYNYGVGIDNIREKLGQLTGEQGDELNQMTGSVKAIVDVWQKDYNDVIRTSNVLVKQLGVDSERSFELIKQGLASGGDATGDFLQQVSEYAPMFKDAQLSAEALVAVVTQGVTSGVFSDKGPDAVKEFMLRVREMTPATAEALQGIGIASDEVQRKLQDGTWTYLDVLKLVSTKLNEFPPQSREVGTAIADIFGGPGEDAGLAYLQTLKDIELDMDKVTKSGGEMTKQQLDQAAASEKLNAEMAELFGGLNKKVRDVKTSALEMAVGVVENFDSISTAVKTGGAAIVAYKAVMVAAHLSTLRWSRTLVVTRRAVQALNTTVKATPMGLVIGLLATAGAAYLAYRDNVDETSNSQDDFNTKLSETGTLLDNIIEKADEASISGIADFLDLEKLDVKRLTAFRQEIDGLSKNQLSSVLGQVKEKIGEVNREVAKLEQDFDRVEDTDIFEGHVKSLETYKKMIAIVEKELGTFTSKEQGWYQQIESQIKSVKKEIDGVAEGDKERLTILQAQLNNLEDQKKKLKELGKVPVKMEMFTIKDDDEEIEDDLEIEDISQATVIMANYKKELKDAAEYHSLLGDSNSLLQEEIDLTKTAIENLLNAGYKPQTAEIQSLMGVLDQLQQKYKSSNATFMNWVSDTQQGIGTMQQGISNINMLGSAYESLQQKQKEGSVSILDYAGFLLQMASSVLGTIQVVDALSKAVEAKQVVDNVSTAKAVSNEAAKSAAVVASETTQASAVTTSALQQAIAYTIMGNAALKANAARGISAAVASAAILPFPANIGAMEMAYGFSSGLFLATQGLAQSLSIPAFADGATVFGSTYALVGEYPGAQNNPELIAPANKMMGYIKQAIGESGGGVGEVEFVIHGDVIRGVLKKSERKSRGYN